MQGNSGLPSARFSIERQTRMPWYYPHLTLPASNTHAIVLPSVRCSSVKHACHSTTLITLFQCQTNMPQYYPQYALLASSTHAIVLQSVRCSSVKHACHRTTLITLFQRQTRMPTVLPSARFFTEHQTRIPQNYPHYDFPASNTYNAMVLPSLRFYCAV